MSVSVVVDSSMTALQVGRRRIDFVYENRDSIEVKMPPPRHMREAALKVCQTLYMPSITSMQKRTPRCSQLQTCKAAVSIWMHDTKP